MTMMADDNDNDRDVNPWRIYGKEYKVSESKMGKSDTDKAYPMLTSSGEGSKVTRGGATIHLQKPKETKKQKIRALDLGTAPSIGKASVIPDMDKDRSGMEKARMMGKEEGDAPESKKMTYGDGRISAHKRESLKPGQFAVRGKKMKKFGLEPKGEEAGRYPIHDLSHARNALARAAQSGNLKLEAAVKRAVYAKYPELKERKEEREGVEDVEKSLGLLDDLAKSMTPLRQGTDLLKACKACMGKSGDENKAYLGELAIPEKRGEKPKFTGEGAMRAGTSYGQAPMKVGKEKISEVEIREGMSKMGKAVEADKDDDKDEKEVLQCKEVEKATPIEIPGGSVNKAVTAMNVPRLPRAMQHEMIRRNAQSVMTRGNSRFAKDIHTGPLTGEVIETVEEEAANRTHRMSDVYKACTGCGRRYRLFKGVDNGCPTCSINKSTHCAHCNTQLVKSHGGIARCPLCG